MKAQQKQRGVEGEWEGAAFLLHAQRHLCGARHVALPRTVLLQGIRLHHHQLCAVLHDLLRLHPVVLRQAIGRRHRQPSAMYQQLRLRVPHAVLLHAATRHRTVAPPT
jgi:hypothetical protein